MHSHTNTASKSRPAFLTYFLTSSCVAVFENILFHWTDTISKRLQNNPIRVSASSPQFTSELKQVILPNVTNVRGTFASLYHGLLTGIAYRVLQRNIMFVGQPRADDFLNQHAGPAVERYLGYSFRGPAIAAVAGFITCVLEMPFLLFDTAKVRMQTQGMSFMEAISAGHLYKATGITMTRNVIAATSLFGGATFVRQSFGVRNPQDASLKQECIAAAFGACLATCLNNWADMLKTRLQGNHESKTCRQIASTIWASEGVRGMFLRGLIPRLCTVAPRIAFTMTAVNQIVKKVDGLTGQGFFSRKKSLRQVMQGKHEENVNQNRAESRA